MGCCFSVSRDPTPEEHYHNDTDNPPTNPQIRPQLSHRTTSLSQSNAPSSSRQRHQTPSSSSNYNARNTTHRSHSHSHPQSTPVPLTQPINTPIIPHTWTSKKRLWTRSLLDRERKEFFETRVTGRAEVWAALNAALGFMRQGDFETAQSIIDAAGVTVPTGDLCQGVYDERGVLYRLPRCIVSDPLNMVAGELDDQEDESGGGSTDGDRDDDEDGEVDVGFETDDRKGGFGYEDEVESGDELIVDETGTGTGTGARTRTRTHDADERERRRDEKGKTSERDLIRVKARLSDRGGADVVVAVRKTQNVGFLARKVAQEVGLPRTQRIRIAYLGKILKEHTSLVEQGWKPGNIVNALVVARRPSVSS
ncbi:ubiquitin domain-containing protein [Aspergillus stella-maris]|uniref:ubiquitin domain-containing protein n=1 Tax=Aspergillus stella-maris TaxID=1810926 RepID=UPI003CCDF95B